MKSNTFTIIYAGIGLLAVLTGCAGHTSSTSVKDATAERIEDPLAGLAVASHSGSSREAGTRASVGSAGSPATAARTNEPPSMFLFDIPFRFDRFTLLVDARAKVEVNAMRVKEQEGDHPVLLLEGRCDEIGSREYNLVLGERRALTVKQYLMQLGIPSSSVEIVSYGKDQPLCTEQEEACWMRNRSVHFVVK